MTFKTTVICLLLVILKLNSSFSLAQVLLTVEDTVVGSVNPHVYGANFGPLSTVPLALLPQAQDAQLNLLRFPGGRWGDTNDIKGFHLDILKSTLDLMNTDLSMQVRLEGGSPQQAIELMELVKEKGLEVSYWHIGNEPNLFDNYTVAAFNKDWRAIATAMLEYDPSIKLIGPDISQWNAAVGVEPTDLKGKKWLDDFLSANGDLLSIVAIHRYPFPSSFEESSANPDALRADAQTWDELIPSLKERIKTLTGQDLPVAVSEVNSHWNSAAFTESSPDSLLSAVWWADVLGKLIYDGVSIVNYFDLQTNPQRGGLGLLGQNEVRPSYYVYQLYQHLNQSILKSSSSDALISIYASKNREGKLSLIVTNLHNEAVNASLTLVDGFTFENAEAFLLDETHLAQEIILPLNAGLLLLPERSVLLLLLNGS